MKKYIQIGLFPLISILTLPIFMTILNLFNLSLNRILLTIIMIIIMFTSGFILGRNIKDKGYLKGLLYGVLLAFIMFILSLILLSDHSLYNIIYYLLLIASTTLGSMIGVNKKG